MTASNDITRYWNLIEFYHEGKIGLNKHKVKILNLGMGIKSFFPENLEQIGFQRSLILSYDGNNPCDPADWENEQNE